MSVIERRSTRTRGQRHFALTLMLIAGWCDAAGFLLFGGLFVSFMSGDATRLGLSSGGGQWIPAVKLLAAQVIFVVGVALGRYHRLSYPDRGRRDLLIANAVLLGATASIGDTAFGLPGFALAVVAMGAQNTMMTQEFGTPVGTMVTGALVRLGANIADRAWGKSSDFLDNFAQWACFVLGALGGAAAFGFLGAASFWPPAIANIFMLRLAARLPAMVEDPQGRLS